MYISKVNDCFESQGKEFAHGTFKGANKRRKDSSVELRDFLFL